jgi:hypothetical protein
MSRLYGRVAVPEPLSAMRALHVHDGVAPLKMVDWEPPVGVLDQEDLDEQGIDTSKLVPGAPKVKALGSCTANTFIEAASRLLSPERFAARVGSLSRCPVTPQTVYSDTVTAEKAAIVFYHLETSQTGLRSQEWPPTDCGSSGVYMVEQAKKLGVCSGAKIAHGGTNIVSLMQTGPIMAGSPFLNAWEEPDASGFIDGTGSPATLERQLQLGVAGGHEYLLSAIERLVLYMDGRVNERRTIIRIRNHWRKDWGDHGSARVHLSTLVALGSHADFRQLTPGDSATASSAWAFAQ